MPTQNHDDSQPIVAITLGDVAGIGPEVAARSLLHPGVRESCRPLIIGHPEILHQAARLFGLPLTIVPLSSIPDSRVDLLSELRKIPQGHVSCWNPCSDDILLAPKRIVSAPAGVGAFVCLSDAIRLAQSQCIDAICTAPLNKESLHLAGHHFPGHTEILAHQCQVDRFAMMLHLPQSRLSPLRNLIQSHDPHYLGDSRPHNTSGLPGGNHSDGWHGLSIAHVTLHTSIASVPELLSIAGIEEKILLMHDFLKHIGCPRRSIAVCALNPHGGENGLFGDEESRCIEPAVLAARHAGCDVTGPLPTDTLMRRAVSGEFDGVVAMYHDQGHIPVKLIGFDSAVNITLGLPIIRTSPTHGTAFDRAWNPDTPSDPSGMVEAIRMAAALAVNRVLN